MANVSSAQIRKKATHAGTSPERTNPLVFPVPENPTLHQFSLRTRRKTVSSTNKRRLFWVIALGWLLLCSAAVIYSQVKPENGPQVVLAIDHSADGRVWVVPKTQVWFVFRPATGTNPAPLARGDYMVCRQYDLHDETGYHVAFRCGADTYVLQGLGIKSEK
jgi:hypothetical protein